MSKIVVVGGGPAGMMAAIAAADSGAEVVLLEKNEKLGKKLYITGKGRCNVTNDSDVENLLRHVRSNARFLYAAFYAFDSSRIMGFLEEEGVHLKTERGARVFPVSDKSSDVIRALADALQQRRVDVRLNTRVVRLRLQDGKVNGVEAASYGKNSENITADAVIVATGGLSYSSTGSTGDGYRFAEEAGHCLVEAVPSLVPFEVKEEYAGQLQGLSLRNVNLSVRHGKKVLYEELGELLFTHYGISGPLVLTASTYLAGRDIDGVTLHIDLKPALSVGQLDERVQRDFVLFRNSLFKNSLGKLLPAKLVPVVVSLSGIDPHKRVNEVTRQERASLVGVLKDLPLTLRGMRGFDEAIITRGGVCVKEVNPSTMESKIVQGLYFAGEVLDLDAETGGYNLQVAWSTGYLAGISSYQS